jgi:short-subunit dehydrogenase
MMAVPYLAAFNLTRAFLPDMLRRGSGAIGFITSPGAFIAWPNAAAYIAARRAVAGLADALRTEVKGKGLTVTLVVLGTVDSPYWQHNPGSRENLPPSDPRLLPNLSTAEAAEAIFAGVEAGRRLVVKPAIFRALFLLNALAPGLVARQLRRQQRQRRTARGG